VSRRRDYDLLRVCSMFAVVFLHVAAEPLRTASGPLWHFANLTTSLATAAVPLFFLLSGALLLSQEQTADLGALLRRRLPKLLTPALVWSGVVLFFLWLLQGRETALSQLRLIISTPVVTPYWFLYALGCIYLLSPLLKRMADALSAAHWKYLVALWVVFTLGISTGKAFAPAALQPLFTVNTVLNLNFVAGYLGYFLLGGWLARLTRLPPRGVLWGIACADVAVIAAGTAWASAAAGAYDERFKSYVNVFAALLAVVIFLLFRSYGENKTSGRLLTLLSGLSFGVYLAHPLAIELWKLVWQRLTGGGLDSVPDLIGCFLAVLLSCLLGVLLAASVRLLCFPLTGQRFRTACRESNLFALAGKRRE
jgi:surface polysaccharide O-acyltransferase-like enzyme